MIVALALGILVGKAIFGTDPYANTQATFDEAQQQESSVPDTRDPSQYVDTSPVTAPVVNQQDIPAGVQQQMATGQEFMIVNIPQYNPSTYELEYIETYAPKSPAVLNATYNTLFALNQHNDTWNGYNFESVSINDGVASVNLSGSHMPIGDLSMMAFRDFINAAAFQYNSVDSIIVRVNGEIFDFCVDDQSGGENGCPDQPRLWIDVK